MKGNKVIKWIKEKKIIMEKKGKGVAVRGVGAGVGGGHGQGQADKAR